MSYDSTSDDMDGIVESNIPVEPNKSFEFSCFGDGFMVIPPELSSSESSEFLPMI